jgi:hypothetical protein
MLVFSKQKLVLMAPPKTGTTALATALAPFATTIYSDPPMLKHMPIQRYQRFVAPLMDMVGEKNLKTVAVVRNPIDWLGSWYKYRGRPFLNGKPQSTQNVDFDTFVTGYMKGDRPAYANVGSQAKFLTKNSPDVLADHLFQYEQMSKLVAFLEDAFETKIDLGFENVSPKRDFDLSPEVEAKFRKRFSLDFDIWEQAFRH